MSGLGFIETRKLERMVKAAPLSTWALFGAGIALSFLLAGSVIVLWLGKWTPEMQSTQLNFIGTIAIMLSLDLMAVIASLAKARVAAHLPGGVNFDVGPSGPDSAQPNVKVTTEVTPQ